MTGRIFSINTSPGGVPKHAVPDAFVSTYGLFGDSQRNRKIHGGPNRAVCLFSIERIRGLEAEGHPISAGTTGENITVSGIDWDAVKPGVVIEAGEALLEVTSFTTPCRTIQGSFADGVLMRMSHKLYPGWSRVYARVLKEGRVRTGDLVSLKSQENYGPSFE
jgi:MOSC domain-containing protein YiiM